MMHGRGAVEDAGGRCVGWSRVELLGGGRGGSASTVACVLPGSAIGGDHGVVEAVFGVEQVGFVGGVADSVNAVAVEQAGETVSDWHMSLSNWS